MSEKKSTIFNDFRTEVIDINRAFAEIRPLIRETRHLSLNAETSSLKVGPAAAAFAVVVKNLNQLSESLGSQVNGIEEVFNSLVQLIGEWAKRDQQIGLHERAHELIAEGAEEEAREVPSIERNLEEGQQDVRGMVAEVMDHIEKLNRQVTELNQVAVRQCRFIAISSMIEAQRIECVEDGDLTTVAGDINDMANRIGKVELEARNRVLNLMTSARLLEQALK